ncbi:hypothetical protein GCM10027048_15630 [Hymenobacter coalescens]
MSRSALELVFPAAVCLLVCSLVVLFLTATGLESGPAVAADKMPLEAPLPADSAATVALDPADAEAVAAGDALFKDNCAQCHAINDVVVGPALAGLEARRPLPWIIKWVQNSSKMVASGDEYAVKIFNQYQKQQMPGFALSNEEIRHIMKYVRSQEGRAASQVGADAVAAVN